MNEEQLNLFGEVATFEPDEKPKRRKFKTMQEVFGLTEGKRCKECKHIITRRYSKNYYKCALWRVSASAASDIRVNAVACGKFESVEG